MLLLWFLGIALLPLGFISWLGYRTSSQAHLESVHQQLLSVAGARTEALNRFFSTCRRDVAYQAHLEANVQMLESLSRSAAAPAAAVDPDAHLRAWTRSAAYQNEVGPSCAALERFQKETNYHDLLLIDTAGNILFSCRQDRFLGTNILTGPLAQERLGLGFHEALDEAQPIFTGFLEAAAGDQPSAFLMRAVHDVSGRTLGVVAFRILADQLAGLTVGTTTSTGSGLHYVVDGDLRLVTAPPEYPALRVLQDVVIFDERPTPMRNDQGRLESAATGDDIAAATVFYRHGFDGREVIGVHQPLTMLGEPMGVIAEINRHDATARLRGLVVGMIGLLMLVTLTVVLAGLVVSRRIVQPLVHLGQLMQQMADGAEVDDLDVGGHNEVGDLADQFAVMVRKLQAVKLLNRCQYELKRSQFELHESMRGLTDSKLLADAVLRFVATHYRADVGVFYLVGTPGKLELAAAYGVEESFRPEEDLRVGEGVLGRAAERLEPLVLQQLPDNHLPIKSATGAWSPASLIVMPIHLAGRIKGVIELGLLSDISSDDLEFLKLSNDAIAAAVDGARSRERVDRLLDETRRQAGELAQQQAELRLTNEQLARSDRYKSEFLANMSHELRTPLNSMLIMSQVLAENRDGNLLPDDIEAASTIHKAGSDLLSIINDILDLSRVEAGKLELHPEALNVRTLTTSLERLFRPVSRDRGLDFRVLLGPDLPSSIVTDPLRVNQILKNLLNNAFKFTQAGSVMLRVRRPSAHELADLDGGVIDDWLVISVADTGIGMSEEIQKRIFEDFGQGDGTIGRRFGGSGLGLSISRKLAGLLDARIAVQSIEGKGSTFTLFLPVSPAGCCQSEMMEQIRTWPESQANGAVVEDSNRVDAAAHSGARESSSGNGGGVEGEAPAVEPGLDRFAPCTVLLADHDMRTLFNLTDRFTAAGIAVQLARDWQECVVAVGRHPVDLAVIGADIPGRCETDFATRLRRDTDREELPVIAMVDDAHRQAALDVDGLLDKPVETAQLCELMTRLLAPVTVPAVSGTRTDGRTEGHRHA